MTNKEPRRARHESPGQTGYPVCGAEGIRTPDLLIAKASGTSRAASAPRSTRAFVAFFRGSGVRRGCAFSCDQKRAADPIGSPHARRCLRSRVTEGHREATRSALELGQRRANSGLSGRRLGGEVRLVA